MAKPSTPTDTQQNAGPPLAPEDYFRVPYRLEVTSIETAEGRPLRHAAYPELRGCTAQAPTLEEALAGVEAKRLRTLIDIIRAGGRPPVPRLPLQSCDPLWLAAQLGLTRELGDLFGLEECEGRPAATAQERRGPAAG